MPANVGRSLRPLPGSTSLLSTVTGGVVAALLDPRLIAANPAGFVDIICPTPRKTDVFRRVSESGSPVGPAIQ